jgi:putative hydrolase of the HAD superfamily
MIGKHFTTVTFDAGGTIIYCDPSPSEIYARHLSRLGRPVHAEEVGPVFREAWAEMQSRTEPGSDRYNSVDGGERAWWGGFVREVLKRLDHDAPWEPLLDDLYAAFSDAEVWTVFPETTSTLNSLRNAGTPLAVISNWDRRLPDILRNLGLYQYFDVVTVSAIEGVEKPSPEIFSRTLDRLGISAEEAIHIGDSPLEDYSGAEGAGLGAALIDRHNLFAEEPYRCISSLEEIVGLLD